jgi:hypothetical protein
MGVQIAFRREYHRPPIPERCSASRLYQCSGTHNRAQGPARRPDRRESGVCDTGRAWRGCARDAIPRGKGGSAMAAHVTADLPRLITGLCRTPGDIWPFPEVSNVWLLYVRLDLVDDASALCYSRFRVRVSGNCARSDDYRYSLGKELV